MYYTKGYLGNFFSGSSSPPPLLTHDPALFVLTKFVALLLFDCSSIAGENCLCGFWWKTNKELVLSTQRSFCQVHRTFCISNKNANRHRRIFKYLIFEQSVCAITELNCVKVCPFFGAFVWIVWSGGASIRVNKFNEFDWWLRLQVIKYNQVFRVHSNVAV